MHSNGEICRVGAGGWLDNHVFAISFQIASSRKNQQQTKQGLQVKRRVRVKTIIKSICNKPHGTHEKRNKNAQ